MKKRGEKNQQNAAVFPFLRDILLWGLGAALPGFFPVFSLLSIPRGHSQAAQAAGMAPVLDPPAPCPALIGLFVLQ